MKLGLRLCAAGIALSIMSSPTQACAARMMATFTGFVETGADLKNAFGLGNTLDGAAFSARYIYDTNLGFQVQTPTYHSLVGGPGFGVGVSPILSASFTVNGFTEFFDMGQDGAANVRNQDGWPQTFFYTNYFADNGTDSTWNYLQLFVLDSPTPVLLTTSYTGFHQPVNAPPIESNKVLKSVWVNGVQETSFQAALSTTSVTLAPAPAPEPTTWTILLTGFFGLGAVLRRRARRALAATTIRTAG
jgi:hypothetical protein